MTPSRRAISAVLNLHDEGLIAHPSIGSYDLCCRTARDAGYREPILMGQNTLGFACRGIVETICGGDPLKVASISGRFSAAGYNGDVLGVETWAGDDVGVDALGDTIVLFRVVNQHGAVLVDRGFATVR